MTKESLEQANRLSGRIQFYTHFEKVLRASGAANIDFSSIKDDLQELEILRDRLLTLFTERNGEAQKEFEQL